MKKSSYFKILVGFTAMIFAGINICNAVDIPTRGPTFEEFQRLEETNGRDLTSAFRTGCCSVSKDLAHSVLVKVNEAIEKAVENETGADTFRLWIALRRTEQVGKVVFRSGNGTFLLNLNLQKMSPSVDLFCCTSGEGLFTDNPNVTLSQDGYFPKIPTNGQQLLHLLIRGIKMICRHARSPHLLSAPRAPTTLIEQLYSPCGKNTVEVMKILWENDGCFEVVTGRNPFGEYYDLSERAYMDETEEEGYRVFTLGALSAIRYVDTFTEPSVDAITRGLFGLSPKAQEKASVFQLQELVPVIKTPYVRQMFSEVLEFDSDLRNLLTTIGETTISEPLRRAIGLALSGENPTELFQIFLSSNLDLKAGIATEILRFLRSLE
jgi:hypothetical protein